LNATRHCRRWSELFAPEMHGLNAYLASVTFTSNFALVEHSLTCYSEVWMAFHISFHGRHVSAQMK
jgi:hypothetical protein